MPLGIARFRSHAFSFLYHLLNKPRNPLWDFLSSCCNHPPHSARKSNPCAYAKPWKFSWGGLPHEVQIACYCLSIQCSGAVWRTWYYNKISLMHCSKQSNAVSLNNQKTGKEEELHCWSESLWLFIEKQRNFIPSISAIWYSYLQKALLISMLLYSVFYLY